MPTLTFKVTPEFKRRLARAARQRKVSVSELVRVSVERELPAAGRGFLLGALKDYSLGASIYDPAAPAFDEGEWEQPR